MLSLKIRKKGYYACTEKSLLIPKHHASCTYQLGAQSEPVLMSWHSEHASLLLPSTAEPSAKNGQTAIIAVCLLHHNLGLSFSGRAITETTPLLAANSCISHSD